MRRAETVSGKLPSMVLPAVAVHEIASAIQRLPPSDKRSFLEERFAELLGSGCVQPAPPRDAIHQTKS